MAEKKLDGNINRSRHLLQKIFFAPVRCKFLSFCKQFQIKYSFIWQKERKELCTIRQIKANTQSFYSIKLEMNQSSRCYYVPQFSSIQLGCQSVTFRNGACDIKLIHYPSNFLRDQVVLESICYCTRAN